MEEMASIRQGLIDVPTPNGVSMKRGRRADWASACGLTVPAGKRAVYDGPRIRPGVHGV